MKRFALICSVVVLALFCTSLRVTARTIAYEGCDYAVTNNVSGLNGGSGWQAGWTWNWASGTKWWQVVEPGLTYADGTTNLAVKGRAFRGSYNGYDQCTRMPSQAEFGHLTDNGFFGKAGTTNWFAFLVKLDGYPPTNGHFGFTLRQPDHFGEKVWLGMRPGVPTNYSAGGWGAPYDPYPNAPVIQGQTTFLVTRFIYGSPTAGWMHISLWTNPSLAGEPDVNSAFTNYWSMTYDAGGLKSRMWDKVSLVAHAASLATSLWFYLDEIRIGETFRDVAPRDFDVSPVERPLNVLPLDGAVDQLLPLQFQASAFISTAPNDVHEQTKITLRSESGVITVVVTNGLTQMSLGSDVVRPATRYTWWIQYKGTNSPAWSEASAATAFSTAATEAPQLIAYDGCTYAPTPFPSEILGRTGGKGWVSSWSESWTAGGLMRIASDAPGLTYQFTAPEEWLLATNNRFRTDERGKEYPGGTEERILQFSRSTRQVGTDGGINLLSPSNLYGKAGTTNWFSFLARYEEGDTTARFGFELIDRVANETPYLFLIGKPANVDNWGMIAAGGTFVTSGVSAIDGKTAFLVTRIIFGAGTETAHLWVNPASRTEPQEGNAVAFTGVPNFEWNRIGMQANSSAQAPRYGVDELRFGTSWEAVMPAGPPPPFAVGTPTNVAPFDAAVDVDVTPTITLSAFNGAGPGDLHVGTEVQFTSMDGVSISIVTGGLTSFDMPAGKLRHATRYSWMARYLGTNNVSWSEWSETTVFTTKQGPPALLAYDGAAYAVTNVLQGRNGGFGWLGAWESMWWNFSAQDYVQTRVGVETPGFEYEDSGFQWLIVTNNRFVVSDEGGISNITADVPASRSRRTLAHDGAWHLLDASNYFGKVGTTNWFSFLCRYESGEQNAYFGLELSGEGAASSRFVIGKPSGASTWGFRDRDGITATSGKDAFGSTAAFLVAQVVFGDSAEEAALWVDPELGPTPPATPDVVMTGITPFNYSRVGMVSHQGSLPCPIVSVDEIRVGESWETVTPYVIPEPLLAVAGLLGVLALRRRVR